MKIDLESTGKLYMSKIGGNLNNFEGIRYFKPYNTSDKWREPKLISRRLLVMLDELRHTLGAPVYVTSGFRAKKKGQMHISQHNYGKAADIVCPSYNLIDLYNIAEDMDWPGLGVYPYWEYNFKRVGGLHLDVRELERGEHLARWMGVSVKVIENGIESEVQKYIALTPDNLKRFTLA